MDFHYLVQDAAIFAQNSRRYRKAEALLLPRLENLKWQSLPEDTLNKEVGVEDRLNLRSLRISMCCSRARTASGPGT